LLWPLWAPFVIDGATRARPRAAVPDALDQAIEAARAASREASMDAVFSEAMATRIAEDVARARDRIAALEAALADQGARAPELGAATSALRARNAERLARLLADQRRELAELAELLEALRSQLVLARFAGSSEADVSGIVREVWSRVEGLGAVIAREDEVRVTTSAEQVR
jgi:exonuclease VII large subunit